MRKLCLYPLEGMGEIHCGDDVAAAIIAAIEENQALPQCGDLLVVAHKIISKAEGREVPLSAVKPSEVALSLCEKTGKPAALVQLVLDESEQVLAARKGLLMCRSRLGWVCANAGVDQSNSTSDKSAILLPLDPDRSAQAISERLESHFGQRIAVIVSDTHGRPLREGITGVAIGSWGLDPLRSYIGQPDRRGRPMSCSIEAVADELAAAASFLMGQGAEGIPAVLIKGCGLPFSPCGIEALKRKQEREIFVANDD